MTEIKNHTEKQELPKKTIAWLGPKGTFTEQAAKIAVAASLTEDRQMVEAKTIDDIFEMVKSGQIDYGIVPIENSTAGPVKETHHGLETLEGIRIVEEHVLPITLTLYMQNPDLVQIVASKDKALQQCEEHLKQILPGRQLKDIQSTAMAVEMAAEDPTVAAVGSSNAAEALGIADRLQRIDGIEDNKSNATTFVLIQKNAKETQVTGVDKTTLIIDLPDQPGSLYIVLNQLAERGINLTKIKSLRRKDSGISFLISVDGHEKEENIKDSITALKDINVGIKSLGSYRRARYEKPESSGTFNMDYAIKNIQQEAQNGNGITKDETVMVFTLPNESGALAKALKPFMESGVNLTKIDSQPSGEFEEYIFYLAFQNNIQNKKQLINEVAKYCKDVVLLNA